MIYTHTDHDLTSDLTVTEETEIFIDDDSLFIDTEETEEPGLSNIILNTARIFGIIGFLFLCISVFIGSCARMMDKFFGLEKVLRFHKYFSIFSFIIILFHPLLLSIYNILNEMNIIDYYSGYITYLPFTFGVISLLAFGIIIIVTLLFYKILNHHIWINLHRLSVICIILILIHIKNFAIMSGMSPQYPLLNIPIITGLLFYSCGIIIRILLFIFKRKFKSKVVKIIIESYNTATVVVEKPKNFVFKAGQFSFIHFKKQFLRKPHPFTISSSPSDEYLSFTIKSHKKFTSSITSLKPGDQIIIDGPYGKFNFKNQKSVFIAGGVGITPFKSILGSKNFIAGDKPVHLFYSCKKTNDIIYYKWLQDTANKLGFLNIKFILTKQKDDNFIQGRINEYLLSKHVKYDEDFYICGPQKMIKSIKKVLKKNQVPNNKIFTEKFFW